MIHAAHYHHYTLAQVVICWAVILGVGYLYWKGFRDA